MRFSSRRTHGFTLVEIMIVVLIIGILLAIAIPNFISARDSSRARACIANLKEIDSAKQQYVMDAKQPSTYTFTGTYSGTTANQLVPNYIRSFPLCPSGGTYTVGAANANPTCSVGASGTAPAHSMT
jgi:prepilin-type N-terminal cleavage/methylation domain-containing protein